MIAPATATCRPADHARLRPQRSCSKKISALACIGFERLGDDAHIADARTFDCIHYGCESPKWNVFIGANEDRLMLWITNLLPQTRPNFIDVDRIIAKKNALLFINADHHTFFGDFLYGARLGDTDFNARLKHRRSNHENDEQNQNYDDQWRDVDIGERGLGASVGSRKDHHRRTSEGSR